VKINRQGEVYIYACSCFILADYIMKFEGMRSIPANIVMTKQSLMEKKQSQSVGVWFAQSLSSKILTPYLKKMTGEYLRLETAGIDSLPPARDSSEHTLYLHIPFCESLCPYCSFNRFLFDEARARDYFQNLRAEMQSAQKLGYHFSSLYIGGGTPTILIDELADTIDLAKELFGITEVSCETNPNHLIPEYLEKLSGRVDRLSVGVQSFDDELLKQMGRYQKFGTGELTLERILNAAPFFPSLNVDMIYNFPNQTEEILRKDIQSVIASGAQQTTFYPLMSSPSVSRALDHSVGKVDYKREPRFYELIINELGDEFKPLSAWTFVRKGTGMIDEYIVETDEYVGLGAGAFSFLDGTLYVNTFSTKQYGQAINSGKMSVAMKQKYGSRERMRYRFMMELFGLRFDRKRFKETFHKPVEMGLSIEMLFMFLAGAFAHFDRDSYTLTPRGKYLSVVMMREFFSGVNNVRDEARKSINDEENMCAFPMKGKQLTVSGD
jgi:menaquinone C8-methyltransferase